MPTPIEILQTLASIANEQFVLAVIWHILIALTSIGILLGWRPTKKTAAVTLAIPLLSVSILAWTYKNPFNGLVFLVFAIAFLAIGLRRPSARVDVAPDWAAVVGMAMIIFGWIYPHFLEGSPWFKYLYAAPTGLIPCPTLSVAIGFALLASGFSSRAYSVTLGILGLFYALFGALRLGVRIDIVLGLGALVLLTLALTPGFGASRKKGTA